MTISLMTVKTITETDKNKNSVEKCEKKVPKPIKQLAVLSKPMGLELFFDVV